MHGIGHEFLALDWLQFVKQALVMALSKLLQASKLRISVHSREGSRAFPIYRNRKILHAKKTKLCLARIKRLCQRRPSTRWMWVLQGSNFSTSLMGVIYGKCKVNSIHLVALCLLKAAVWSGWKATNYHQNNQLWRQKKDFARVLPTGN